jgi:hypothetical protein
MHMRMCMHADVRVEVFPLAQQQRMCWTPISLHEANRYARLQPASSAEQECCHWEQHANDLALRAGAPSTPVRLKKAGDSVANLMLSNQHLDSRSCVKCRCILA